VKTATGSREIGEEFDQVLAADLSPDQTHVALGGPGKLIKIYSTKDGELLHSIKKHTDWVTAMEFSPTARSSPPATAAAASTYGKAARAASAHPHGPQGAITDLSWRADSALPASSSEDGQVIVWEIEGRHQGQGLGRASRDGVREVRHGRPPA
jgi:WD40 repeat protein